MAFAFLCEVKGREALSCITRTPPWTITSLTGKGPSAAVSYAGLPAADIPVFESLIGKSLDLSMGTGYSPISVQAVPEPSPRVMGAVGIACAAWGARRASLARLRRAGTPLLRPTHRSSLGGCWRACHGPGNRYPLAEAEGQEP